MFFRVRLAATPVIDVDGSYLYRKRVQLNSSVDSPPPNPPLTGWKVVNASNVDTMSKHIPRVMPGIYTLTFSRNSK